MGLDLVVSGIVSLDGQDTDVEISIVQEKTIIVIDSVREMRTVDRKKLKLIYNFMDYEIDSILTDQDYMLKMVLCFGYVSRDIGNYFFLEKLGIKKPEPIEIGPKMNGKAYDRVKALSYKPEFAKAQERLGYIRDAFKNKLLRDDCIFQKYNFHEDARKILAR